jgi:hypothetical protein
VLVNGVVEAEPLELVRVDRLFSHRSPGE